MTRSYRPKELQGFVSKECAVGWHHNPTYCPGVTLSQYTEGRKNTHEQGWFQRKCTNKGGLTSRTHEHGGGMDKY